MPIFDSPPTPRAQNFAPTRSVCGAVVVELNRRRAEAALRGPRCGKLLPRE